MKPRPCLIGLDPPQSAEIQQRFGDDLLCYEMLPRILVQDGRLWVESASRARMLPVCSVVFHGIFEDDHDLITGLALWGGPCMPKAAAMMDCRLKLPCLARALQHTAFGSPARGFASADVHFAPSQPSVAKWGNWHCGENKSRFDASFTPAENSIIEPFIPGEAVRVVVIGPQAWQIRLDGDDWLKSIHHSRAQITAADSTLVKDTRKVAAGFGLEIAANDYIVSPGGQPHLLEVNHIPNVTRFPEIWQAYADYVVQWLKEQPTATLPTT